MHILTASEESEFFKRTAKSPNLHLRFAKVCHECQAAETRAAADHTFTPP
jgi:hypothetical protein